MLKTRDETCARRYRFGHPARNHERPIAGIACPDVTKPRCRGGCTAHQKGVFKHRAFSGLGGLWHAVGCACQGLLDVASACVFAAGWMVPKKSPLALISGKV